MSRLTESLSSNEYVRRLHPSNMRVKIWRWHTPMEVQEDGGLVFSAADVASRFGNRHLRDELSEDPGAELVICDDSQEWRYKTTVGLLVVRNEILPVHLQTYNTDGVTGLPAVQHALIDTREHPEHGVQVQFR